MTSDTFCNTRAIRAMPPEQYLGVAIDLGGVTTVMLPGTGSDDDYIARAFAGRYAMPARRSWHRRPSQTA